MAVIVFVIEVIILIVEMTEGAHTEIITNTNSQIAETTTSLSRVIKSKNFRLMRLKIM